MKGWSGADKEGGPLYDPETNSVFIQTLKEAVNPQIEIQEVDYHINDSGFAAIAANLMNAMIQS